MRMNAMISIVLLGSLPAWADVAFPRDKAAHVVASQPETLCPMVEYGEGWMPGRQSLQTRLVAPEAGILTVPTEPGLGPGLDGEIVESS